LVVNDISWLNSNQFTTTNALTNVEEGDEVEIIGGSYAGQHCTIESVEGETTKTVTVDTTLGVLNALSDVQIDAWKAIETTITDEDGEWKRLGSTDSISPSRQYKIWMKGNVTVREVISKSNSKEQL
jgi:preprotein translocase subunit YajC